MKKSDSLRWPDVFIVGAGRSGTTALNEMLRSHPSLRVCDHKSPNFFVSDREQPVWETQAARLMAQQWTRDSEEYLAMFAGARPEQVLLEASPVYMQALGVAQRIHSVSPQAKIVAILRDPAERAFAHYLGRRRDGIEPAETFEDWLEGMRDVPLPDDVSFGHYVGCGRYAHFLDQYFEVFGKDRVLLLFHDDFVATPDALVAQLLTFIGVDATVRLDTDVRANQSGEIGNPVMKRIWTSTVRVRTRLRPFIPSAVRRSTGKIFLSDLERPTLGPQLRKEIIDLLESDIRRLAAMTTRDLSSWLV